MGSAIEKTEEFKRLTKDVPEKHLKKWYKWGPYVSERAWGTVREDYSENGDAWNYFPYDMAKSRAFRWGEDGIAGICDRFQLITLSFAFWNEQDRELKERLFGVNPYEANHGEDVKEYYYYLDNTPTHSYMRFLYKYPQSAFPYEKLIEENRKRSRNDREYELIDTGVFNEGKYFDIVIEYAKNTSDDICIKLEVFNRGAEPAPFHLLSQLTYRKNFHEKIEHGQIKKGLENDQVKSLLCSSIDQSSIFFIPYEYATGINYFYGPSSGKAIFTNNETNYEQLFGSKNPTPYVKDAFHRYVVKKEASSINPSEEGSKAALYYPSELIPGRSSKVFLFRLTPDRLTHPLKDVEKIVALRKEEADAFYEELHPKNATAEEKMIQRQALSGLLWSKQFYYYDVKQWLKGDDPKNPPPTSRIDIRNKHWKHLLSMRILLMPDKWEYPWFAAWDLAFHAITMALIDIKFAKEQVWLLLFDQFQHPNGQLPAYEWDFSEMNPPVQASIVWHLYEMEYKKTGKKDREFLEKCFHKLMINFTWWVNKVDANGNNVFEGGFLGLDNITIIDRSMKIPGGGRLEQSDGTGWMGMFCLSLMRIALELAKEDHVYELAATKFFQHYVYIAAALHFSETRDRQIWNEEEGFFYDVLLHPQGKTDQILVRSLVGIIPLYGMDFLTEEEMEQFPEFKQNFHWFLQHRSHLASFCITPIQGKNGPDKYLLSLMNLPQVEKVLTKVWDTKEFRSEYGLRSLSKVYENNPYSLLGNSITYEPAESHTFLKGGNSNWRGPIWFPTTFLLIESLKKLGEALGEGYELKIGKESIAPREMARYFAKGLINLFKLDQNGKRPVFGDCEIMQKDPFWKDCLLFYEHFHGDSGRGLGASHQTGWTALIANLIDEWTDKN